jgi:hypothetical protein
VIAIIELLDNLISHAGGGGMESAFDTFLNEKAGQTGCHFEIRKGLMVWKGAPPEDGCYVKLLDEAIRYSKSVIPTGTIDRNLRELERRLPSRIVQAAEENRLRTLRWLEEKRV